MIIGAPAGNVKAAAELAAAAVRGGVDVVQVRWKGASTGELRALTEAVDRAIASSGALLFVNDDVDLAREAEAVDGVHVGQGDVSVGEARRLLGAGKLFGLSTHSVAQVHAAAAAGVADYLGFGAMFDTSTKQQPRVIGPELLARVRDVGDVPIFAIGGITLDNIDELTRRGCGRAAVSGAIVNAADPEQAARELRARLEVVPLRMESSA